VAPVHDHDALLAGHQEELFLHVGARDAKVQVGKGSMRNSIRRAYPCGASVPGYWLVASGNVRHAVARDHLVQPGKQDMPVHRRPQRCHQQAV